MKFTLLATLLFLFIALAAGETAPGGGGGGTSANHLTEGITSSETLPDTTISGVKGIHTGSLDDSSSTDTATPSGPTSTYTVTNGGGGGGGTFTATTTLASSPATTMMTSPSSSSMMAASSSETAAAAASSSVANKLEGKFAMQVGILYALAACLVTGVIALV